MTSGTQKGWLMIRKMSKIELCTVTELVGVFFKQQENLPRIRIS